MRRIFAIGASLALAGSLSIVTAVAAQEAPHPVHIHQGVCPSPGDVVAPLTDLALGTDAAQGVATAIPVEVSITTVDLALADILAADHSINAHESADALDVYIACGDIGGSAMAGADLAIGLAEQNASGHWGVAWLHDNGDGTTNVTVFLAHPATMGDAASSEPASSPMADASPMAHASPMADASPMPEASPAA